MKAPSETAALAPDSVSDELAKVEAIGLIVSAEVSAGVENNLELLGQHYAIVAAALIDQGSAPE